MTTKNLRLLMENIWQVTKDIDLNYSEYDEQETGKGWYFQKYPGGFTTDCFKSDSIALKAFSDGKLKFNERVRK